MALDESEKGMMGPSSIVLNVAEFYLENLLEISNCGIEWEWI
jgi:hypothetical protein